MSESEDAEIAYGALIVRMEKDGKRQQCSCQLCKGGAKPATPAPGDVVERLRARADLLEGWDHAADENAQIRILREAAALIEEMRKALEPFAFAAKFADGNKDEDCRHVGYGIKSGDLRRARRLATTQEKE